MHRGSDGRRVGCIPRERKRSAGRAIQGGVAGALSITQRSFTQSFAKCTFAQFNAKRALAKRTVKFEVVRIFVENECAAKFAGAALLAGDADDSDAVSAVGATALQRVVADVEPTVGAVGAPANLQVPTH